VETCEDVMSGARSSQPGPNRLKPKSRKDRMCCIRGLSTSENALFFSLMESRANIWLAEFRGK
jgi:hypothetical protein